MAEADIRVDYLSVGANRYASVADWSESGLLAFGADNNVCIWNPTVSILESLQALSPCPLLIIII